MAAAANLSSALPKLVEPLRAEGIEVTFSFGSTANLAQQIESGAPFDVFAAADTEHVDALVAKNLLLPNSRAVYAVGKLVAWTQKPSLRLTNLHDLAAPEIRFIAVAKPEVAPYGRAAVEALRSVDLWDKLEEKIVYAQNVNMARQFAASGNADAALTSLSLVIDGKGHYFAVNPSLHTPVEQALGIVTASSHQAAARRFADFLLGERGQALLAESGYGTP